MGGAAPPGAAAAAFMAATSSLVAKRPLMRGRTSAYALRLWYRIVFSKVRLFRFSRYLCAENFLCRQPLPTVEQPAQIEQMQNRQ